MDSDERLWRKVMRGDDDAFATLWDRHVDRVHRQLLRLSGGGTEADDLTALTFLEAWKRRRHVRFVDESLLPWLLVTASNLQRNDARSRARYTKVLARAAIPAVVEDAATQFERSQLDPRLAVVLDSLNDSELALLLLVALEGLSIKDAAAATGTNESTARTRLSRARSRLRADTQLRELLEGTNS